MTTAAADTALVIADCLLKITALLLLALSACFALRHATAARRHLILRGAFVAVLLPPLALLAPSRPTYRLSPLIPSLDPPNRRLPLPAVAKTVMVLPESRSRAIFPVEGSSRPFPWGSVIIALYASGPVVTITPLIAGWLSVRRLGARAGIADEILANESMIACRRMGVRRRVSLRLSDEIAVPMTWGWRRPVILLPMEAAEWPPERRQAALLHEAAHIARNDWAAQIFARLVCSLYWFHPLVWLAAARMRSEAERASDDQVLLAGVPAPDYAQHLLGIACTLRSRCHVGQPAALAMAHTRRIETRLRAILDAGTDRHPLGNRATGFLFIAVMVLLLPFAAVRPTVAQPPTAPPTEEKRRSAESAREYIRNRQQMQRYAEMEQRLAAMEQEIKALSLEQDARSQDRRLLEFRLQAAREAVALARERALLRMKVLYYGGKATSIQERLKNTQDSEQRQRLARVLDFAKSLRDKATSDLEGDGTQPSALLQRVSELATEKAYLLVTLRDTEARIGALIKRLGNTKNAQEIDAIHQELGNLETARAKQKVRIDLLEHQLQEMWRLQAQLKP